MISFPVNRPSHPHCEASVSACATVGDFSSLHPSPFFSFSCPFSGSFTGPKTSVASVLMFSSPRQAPTLRPVSPLAATLMGLPVNAANKRLTGRPNPLDATLTKNWGEGTPNSTWASASHAIRNGGLHPIEKNQPTKNNQRHRESRCQQQQARRLPAPGNGPAETVNHSRHGVEPVQPPPAHRNERGRVRHRRSEHPELDQKWNHVPHVAVQSI